MSQHRQLVFEAPRQLAWHDVPAPAIEADTHALVRPLAVARCDLDVAIARGLVPVPGPFRVGHEAVGEVIAVASAVRAVTPGDRVVVPFQISCGA